MFQLGMGDTTLWGFDTIPILFLTISSILIPILIISFWQCFPVKIFSNNCQIIQIAIWLNLNHKKLQFVLNSIIINQIWKSWYRLKPISQHHNFNVFFQWKNKTVMQRWKIPKNCISYFLIFFTLSQKCSTSVNVFLWCGNQDDLIPLTYSHNKIRISYLA